jgi:hypothetical protein
MNASKRRVLHGEYFTRYETLMFRAYSSLRFRATRICRAYLQQFSGQRFSSLAFERFTQQLLAIAC